MIRHEQPSLQALEAKLKELNDLPAPKREAMIRESFIHHATTSDGTPDFMPFFERKHIAGNPEVRQAAVDIGVEYADILLVQRANQLYHNPATGVHHDPIMKFTESDIDKELALLNDRATEKLQEFQPQIDGYKNARGENAVNEVLGSIINIARKKILSELTGVPVDTALESDDPSVPKTGSESRFMLSQHYPRLRDITDLATNEPKIPSRGKS